MTGSGVSRDHPHEPGDGTQYPEHICVKWLQGEPRAAEYGEVSFGSMCGWHKDTHPDGANPHEVKVGQVWLDNDKRNPEPRYLKVVAIDELLGRAIVARVNSQGGAIWGKYAPRPIKLTRFKPTHTGYRLVKDVTP